MTDAVTDAELLAWLTTELGLAPGLGFTEPELAAAEDALGLAFPPDYRQLLRVVGAPTLGTDAFHDWRRLSAARIAELLGAPLDGLVFDLVHGKAWDDDWGPAPPREEAALTAALAPIVRAQAAPLIPIYGHRYLVGAPLAAGNPVLSIHQTDVIVYGGDLRAYLANERGPWTPCDDASYARARATPFWGAFLW